MPNVIDLHKKDPTMTGQAVCLTCRNEWVATEPIGTVEFECPGCSTWKGVFAGTVKPEDRWICKCGNEVFYVTDSEIVCARCGISNTM